MPVPLAAQSDVEALLGVPLTTIQATYVGSLLTMASEKVRTYCRQVFTITVGDVITLNGSWGSRLTLPQRPVTNVSSVLIRGQVLTVGSWVWDRFGRLDLVSAAAAYNDYDNIFGPPADLATGASTLLSGGRADLSGPAGSIYSDVQTGPSWGGPSTHVTVTYDHGYAAIPGDITNEVAGMVAAQLSTPIGVLNETIGGYKATYIRAPGGAMTLPNETKLILDRYRIKNGSMTASLPR